MSSYEATMKRIRLAGGLLLGSILMTEACTERSTPTGMIEKSGVAFSADATGANISVVLDPVGDVVSKGNDYQDIVRAETAKQGRDFAFVMELAAAVPDNPLLPSGADVIDWVLGLDTDPAAFPVGYPFGKNEASDKEFFIEHRQYRAGFADPLDPTSSPGILIDRRPLLIGGQAIITPIQFSIEGAKITWVVDAALLGDPSTFQWGSATCRAQARDHGENGHTNVFCFDFAPDGSLATWPQ